MDYNWLLTTIAQSSAALVGISSGFLILRISLFANRKNNLENEVSDYEILLIDKYRSFHGDIKDIPDYEEPKKIYNDKKRRMKELRFPYIVFIGLTGIVWLLWFGLYRPVEQLSKFTFNYSNIQNIKIYFFIGLGILGFYLIVEVFNAAYPNLLNSLKNKLVKSKDFKKDKTKEST
jgi:hypothetical protein